jgi:hypothetical protein
MGPFRRKPKQHIAGVFDIRPYPGEKDPYDPYFVAMCDCGWAGPPRPTREEAFADAAGHTPAIKPEVERLLG